MSELPESVAWFVHQLRDSGFTQVEDEAGSMDSRLLAFRREPVELRLIKDRGQWSVDLIADGWAERDRVHFPLFHGFALAD